ncbi:hypothetical protein N8D25_13820 (plasmid) [Enterococcus faecium]
MEDMNVAQASSKWMKTFGQVSLDWIEKIFVAVSSAGKIWQLEIRLLFYDIEGLEVHTIY